MCGWIKLHRKSLDHWLYNESRPHTRREAWEDMLLLCNHDDTKILIHGELISCKRGQSVMSLNSWANHFKWTIQKVRTFFELLKSDAMIEMEGLKKTTRITICNYDIYQNLQQTDNTQTTFEQHTDNRQTTTNKNDKNIDTSSLRSEVLSTDVDQSEGKSKSSTIDFEGIKKYWNENTSLPKVDKITETRKKAIRARWKEHGRDAVALVMKKTFASKYLNGNNDRNWAGSFDWIFKPTNFIKIIEGNYDNERFKEHTNGKRISTAEQAKLQAESNTRNLAERIMQEVNQRGNA